jgi:short subunit dehydrogenase-like uncharacterized protein
MTTLAETQARRRERSRKYDLVLWGASGFTGRLTADYLRRAAPANLRWAIGGRDREKLARVQQGLGLEVDVVVGNSGDAGFMARLASDAGVVCSTVGPYARHGGELVAACATRGTDYCDLTGEVQWVRKMIDAHHDRARESGARIVHACGFDSVPSDLGCLMLHEHYRGLGGGLVQATLYVGRTKGAMSGGTFASLLNLVEEARRDPEVREVLRDAYSLNPPGMRSGPDKATLEGVRHESGRGWTAPFLMAPVNTRVVRRSNALLGFPYGSGFRYDEKMCFPDSVKGMLMATAVSAGLAAFAGVAAFGPTRTFLEQRVLPGPGEGPSEAERAAGFFKLTVASRGHSREGELTLEGRVEADQDPGYGATSRMLGEAALCLAIDGPTLDSGGGVLTPASALGTRLLERLRRAGMTFSVAPATP